MLNHYNLEATVSEIVFRLPKNEILVYRYKDNCFEYVKNDKIYFIIYSKKGKIISNDPEFKVQLNLNKKYQEFLDIIYENEFFKKIYEKIGLISFPRTTSYFEIFVRAIIEQQISYNAALKIQNNIIKTYGKNVNGIGYSFPSPETLLNADLTKIGVSKKKEEYIKNICCLVLNKQLELDKLEKMEKKEIYETLLPIKGIGPWSIEHIMLRGYGRYDFLPTTDLFFKRLCENYKIRNIEKYEEWKGLLGYYLVVYHNWFKG